MRKLLFIAMIIASLAAKAQMFSDNKLYFVADNSGVEFDFSDSSFLNNCYLDIKEKDNFGAPESTLTTRLSVGSLVLNQNYNSAIIVNSPGVGQHIIAGNYSITFGKYYKVDYRLTSSFYYRNYFSYPNSSMYIKIYVLDGNNDIMATYTVASITLNMSFDYTYSCWDCSGNMGDDDNIIDPFYDGSALFSANRLSPTSDYEDLYYDNRSSFMNQIARCVFVISFRG